MEIKFIDLNLQYQTIKSEIDNAIQKVIKNSSFIGGHEILNFEKNFASLIGTRYSISCGNGTDALYIAMKALNLKKNEEVSLNPILVSTDLDEGFDHNVLIALNGVFIKEKDWQRFAKIYYFFDDQDITEKENARSMWKSFSAVDIDCKYWINKKNKWVLANSR